MIENLKLFFNLNKKETGCFFIHSVKGNKRERFYFSLPVIPAEAGIQACSYESRKPKKKMSSLRKQGSRHKKDFYSDISRFLLPQE